MILKTLRMMCILLKKYNIKKYVQIVKEVCMFSGKHTAYLTEGMIPVGVSVNLRWVQTKSQYINAMNNWHFVTANTIFSQAKLKKKQK